jgi:hypothetical protein
MSSVYSKYVASFPDDAQLETCFDMWFDLVGDAVKIMLDGPEKDRVADAVFKTLVRILTIEDSRCQHAALHGLGHLPHPRRRATVADWLRRNRSRLSPAAKDWVRQCRDGTVM